MASNLSFVKRKIEQFGNGLPIYILTLLVALIFKLDSIDPVLPQSIGTLVKKLLRIRLRIGYDYHFCNLNIIKAYEFRIRYLLAIRSGLLTGDVSAAELYLSIISEPDLLASLDLPEHIITILGNLNYSIPELFDNPISTRINIGSVVMCGPAADLHQINFDQYDYAVFNKPPPSTLRLPSSKIILILNYQFVLKEFDYLNEWLNRIKPAYVISPLPVEYNGALYEPYRHLPKFLFGASLMGLQRNLIIIRNIFSV